MGSRAEALKRRSSRPAKAMTMNWTSLDEFLHMGGYGLYVWGSYGVTLVVMLAEALMARHRLRAAQRAVTEELEAGL
jgi:heme exporter protein D